MSAAAFPAETPAPCLDEAGVQRAANGDASAVESAHVAGCSRCAERVEEARHEADFLGRARSLLGADLGPIGAPRLAGYRPLGVVSTGAQGVVYRALQESTQRTVAIKVLAACPPGERGSGGEGDGADARTASVTRRRARAEREVEIIARLRHPNIVSVHESRTVDIGSGPDGGGRVALVMEYVDGVPLDRWQPGAGGGAPVDKLCAVLRVFVQVCAGVHHAHLNGVIHRDLKPDNILVTAEGRPVVLDFGVAKLNAVQGAGGGLSTTATGDFAGTPAYASPEQVAAKPEEVDALTDVYSLGVILYRLVCGRLPYDLGETIFEAARVIGSVDALPPRRVDAAIPRDLEAIILRALCKQRAGRYQSAAALGRDIERFLAGEPVEARSESGWYLLRKAVLVNRARLGVIAAAVLLLGGAGVAVWLSLASAAESSRLASRRQEDARREHVRARAVDELIREALPGVDPLKPELSKLIGSRLGRLYLRLETGAFEDDPDVDQEIRRLWGRIYTGLGSKAATHVEYAEVSLRHGLVRLRTQHSGDHPQIAATLHQLADVLLVRRRYEEAAAMAEQALAMRTRFDGADSRAVAESRALRARVLFARGETDAAGKEASEVTALLSRLPHTGPDLLLATMQAVSARAMLKAGDGHGASPLALSALRQRLSLLRADDADVIDALSLAADCAAAAPESELGRAVLAAWSNGHAPADPAASIATMRKDLVLISEPDRGDYHHPVPSGRTDALARLVTLHRAVADDEMSLVGTLLLEVESASAEKRFTEKAAAAQQAAQILGRRFGPNHFAVLVCVQDAAVTCLCNGQIQEALDLTARSCQIWDTVPASARDNLLVANSHRYRAWALNVGGQFAQAEAEARTAAKLFEAAAGPRLHTIAVCRAFAAFALAEQGKLEEAQKESKAALDMALSTPTSPFDLIATVRFVRGHVCARTPGAELEAREQLQKAWDIFFCDFGEEFQWQALLRADAAQVCRRLGDNEGAARWEAMRPTYSPIYK